MYIMRKASCRSAMLEKILNHTILPKRSPIYVLSRAKSVIVRQARSTTSQSFAMFGVISYADLPEALL
jgi:hypothetical protein